MAAPFHCLTYHLIWSTRNRVPWLIEDLEPHVWECLAGIARQQQMTTLAIGGHADHVHLLVRLPPTQSVEAAVALLKGLSARWLRDRFPGLAAFAWQTGYSAFSVSSSQVPALRHAIQHQSEQHRVRTYREELIGYLNRHGIAWHTETVWR